MIQRKTSASRGIFTVFLAALIIAGLYPAPAEAKSKRPRWNQEEAVRRVQAVLKQEQCGSFDWDKIAWLTDADEAAQIAEQEQKPIFLFFFLRTNVGPAAAPC